MPTVRKALAYVLGESCGQENHILPVNAMQYALSRRQLYTGGRDGLVKVWDCEPVNEPAEDAFLARDDAPGCFSGPAEDPVDVDESMLRLETAISSAPLMYKVPLSRYSTRHSRSQNMHFDWINDIKLVNGNRHLVTASSDLSLKLLDLDAAENNVERFLNVHTDYIQKLSSMPAQNTVISGGLDGMMVVWDLATLKPITQFHNIRSSSGADCTSIYALSNDNRNLISVGGPDSLINIYDQRVGASGAANLVWRLVGHQDTVRCLLMNTQCILSGSSDTSVKLWDLRNFSIYKSFEYHDEAVWNLCTPASSDPGLETAVAHDFKIFYSGDKGGNIVKTDLHYLSTHSYYDEPDPYGTGCFSSKDMRAIDDKLGVCTLVAKAGAPVVALCAEGDASLFVSLYESLDRYYIPDTRQLAKYQYLRTCVDYSDAVCAQMDDDAGSLDIATTNKSELDSDFYDIVSHFSIDLNGLDVQKNPGIADSDNPNTIDHLSMFLDTNGDPSGEYVNVYKDDVQEKCVQEKSVEYSQGNNADALLVPVDRTPVEILLYPVPAASIVTIPFNKHAFQTFAKTARLVVAKRMLNNKRQVFALYSNGDIVLWDLLIGKERRRFASGYSTDLSTEQIRAHIKTMDELFEQHQTKDSLCNWCEVDICAGKLLVWLGELSFNNVEVYYDELLRDYPFLVTNASPNSSNISASGDDRFRIARILLGSVFNNYALTELEADRNMRETLKTAGRCADSACVTSDSADDMSRRRKLLNKITRSPPSTKTSVLTQLKTPTSSSPSSSCYTGEVAVELCLDECSGTSTVVDDSVLAMLLSNKRYYREFYNTQGAKKTVPSLLNLYSNDVCAEEEETEHRPLIEPQHFAPKLAFFVFEISADLGNFRDLGYFSMEEISSLRPDDMTSKAALITALRTSLPRWIGKAVLQNEFPTKELPKLSFQLFEVDYAMLPATCKIGGRVQKKIKKLPRLESNIRLTSHSMFRVSKILMYVVEKFGSKTPEMRAKLRAVEWLALECRGVELEPTMTLQAIKTMIWKSSSDVELYFRRKFDP